MDKENPLFEKEDTKIQLAKVVLGAIGGFLAGKMIEVAIDKVVERRQITKGGN